MTDSSDIELIDEITWFIEQCRSLLLSTVDENGKPLASYAPFVRDDSGAFYVYVSKLSQHTSQLALGNASILLIEDESKSKQIYARKRLGFQCAVSLIDKSETLHQDILAQFYRRHGEVIELLTTLPDFLLFALKPHSGTFVKGFGQAYRVNPEVTETHHIGPDNLDR